MKSSFATSSYVSLKSFRISKIRCDLWIEELLNVAHTHFIKSTIQVDCYKPKISALGSILEKSETLKN